MLRLILALAATIVALCANGARAATFDVIRSGPDAVTLLDPTAVEAVAGTGVRRARSVSIQRNLVSGGPQRPGYVSTLNEYDCGQWAIRWKSFSVYSRFGDLVLHKDNPDAAWGPIDNRNFEAAAGARIVCDGGAAGSVYTGDTIGQVVLAVMQAWDAAAPMPPLQPVRPLPRAAHAKPRDKAASRR
jgi:hypothetical protein